MQLRYDLNVGALYVRLSGEPVTRTLEVDDNTFVDLDSGGDIVGIEVVSIEHPWALADVLRDYDIPPFEQAQLRSYFQPGDIGSVMESPAISMALV